MNIQEKEKAIRDYAQAMKDTSELFVKIQKASSVLPQQALLKNRGILQLSLLVTALGGAVLLSQTPMAKALRVRLGMKVEGTSDIPVESSPASDKITVQQMIIDDAQRLGVDPKLALSIAEQESNTAHTYKNGKIKGSSAGAVGIFQLTKVAETDANKFLKSNLSREIERDNITLGVAYLKVCENYLKAKGITNPTAKEIAQMFHDGVGAYGKDNSITRTKESKKYSPEVIKKMEDISDKDIQKIKTAKPQPKKKKIEKAKRLGAFDSKLAYRNEGEAMDYGKYGSSKVYKTGMIAPNVYAQNFVVKRDSKGNATGQRLPIILSQACEIAAKDIAMRYGSKIQINAGSEGYWASFDIGHSSHKGTAHKSGRAIDLQTYGNKQAQKLFKACAESPYVTGIGCNPSMIYPPYKKKWLFSDGPGHLHVEVKPVSSVIKPDHVSPPKQTTIKAANKQTTPPTKVNNKKITRDTGYDPHSDISRTYAKKK